MWGGAWAWCLRRICGDSSAFMSGTPLQHGHGDGYGPFQEARSVGLALRFECLVSYIDRNNLHQATGRGFTCGLGCVVAKMLVFNTPLSF